MVKSVSRFKSSDTLAGYIFMAPTIIILGVFLMLPILIAVVLAFHKIQLLGEFGYRFNQLNNFIRMISDERVWIALRNTAEYVAIVVPTQTILALILAVILNAKIKGKTGFELFSLCQL